MELSIWFKSKASWANLLTFIVCTVGCLWQVYYINDIYFKYSTTIAFHMHKPDYDELPAFSICTFLKDTLYKKNVDKYVKKTGKDIDDYFTIPIRDLHELGVKAEDIFTSCVRDGYGIYENIFSLYS